MAFTMEFPHKAVGKMVDTIYHGAFSLFISYSVKKIFAAHGFSYLIERKYRLWRLWIYGKHDNAVNPIVLIVLSYEDKGNQAGLQHWNLYLTFGEK